MKILAAGALFSATLLAPAWSQIPFPSGSQFQVNGYTTSNQLEGSVSAKVDGDFIVVWQSAGSNGTDSSGYSIQGQRFTADGTPLGDEFQINSYTTGFQNSPSVAVDDDTGNFVVVWSSLGSAGTDSDSRSIQGGRFGAAGTLQGGQFQINTYTTGNQNVPKVAMDADGAFVVVWTSYGSSASDTDSNSIQGQRFAADATPLGGEFQINTYTTGNQPSSAIAVNADGHFVVIWSSDGSAGSDTSYSSVQGQRFAADGSPLGIQFQVNTYTTYTQREPSVAINAGGAFVAVWTSDGSSGSDSSNRSVQGQRFAADGTPLGGEFQVNTYTTSAQSGASVALNGVGEFVVVWDSFGSNGLDLDSSSIQARAFSRDGTAVGSDFEVNTYTTSYQIEASVSLAASGNFVVAWESYGSNGTDTSGLSIQARRYLAATIFTDGFESGDTSVWSGTEPSLQCLDSSRDYSGIDHEPNSRHPTRGC